MNSKKISCIAAILMAALMLVCSAPTTAFAAIANWSDTNVVYDETTFGTNGYYNVISKKDYVLVPGAATESEMVLNNASGTRRQVLHIIELDPSNPDVSIVPGYYGIDKDITDVNNQKAAGVTEVAKYYEEVLGYNVVGAMNTDLYYEANAPRVLVYNGVDMRSGRNTQSVLCVYKNAEGVVSCDVKAYNAAEITKELAEGNAEHGALLHAVGVSFAMTVKNGELVSKTEERTSSPAARSMVGVKEDGTLVICMNDGRGANNSVGFCNYELGESMLALGCKWAANCDGGGSSSFVTKRVGEDALTMRSVPCDGAERPTIHSVLVVSNVGKTGVLDTVNIESDYDYFAPGTSYKFGAQAIDTHGYAMNMPDDAAWTLADTSFGTIEDGMFVSNGKIGDATIQIVSAGTIIGEKTIHIANPTTLKFTQESTVLPYGKSTTLSFVSTIGEAEVYLDGNSFDYDLSNTAAGTLNGMTFTATTDETISGTTITATYKATGAKLTFVVNLGKGSEVLFNFEDGDISDWMGTDDTIAWLRANGVTNPLGTLKDGGQISECCKTTTFLSTRENGGKVHNGNNALGINFDMTQVPFNTWVYGIVYNIKGNTVLRDVNNGKNATTLGMWMYAPEDFHQTAGKMAFQLTVYAGFDGSHYVAANSGKAMSAMTGTTGYGGNQITFKYNGKNINALSESDIPENRWIYATADISGWDYVSLVDPIQDDYRSPSFLRTYIKPDVCRQITWYIDDITLDYSSAVDDRVPPTISNPQYATSDTNISFTDGVTITDVSAGFTATISDDNSGINASTAAIYVDGNKVGTTKVTGNLISCGAVSLGVGTHKVKFEIADKLGNYTTLTRTIVSATEDPYMVYRTRIELDGHNDSGEAPMPGSVYYIDVCNSYSEGIGSAEFTLALNTANTWILDQITVADGYNVSYKVHEGDPNKVTFTCSSANMNGGKTVMFSIPVRVYNPELTGGSDGSEGKISGTRFKADLTVEVVSCRIDGTFGNYDKLKVISGTRQVDRHEHTAVALEDKAATCAETGYTGRTYCEVCKSVVDFGETIPAKGHNYIIVDGKFVCADEGCGKVYESGTGLFELNGKKYYSINGMLQTGWQTVDDGYCYADAKTYEVAVGEKTINGVTYTFDENGILAHGEWVVTEKGTKYSYGPAFYKRAWVEIDRKQYYFGTDAYMYTGIRFVKDNPAVVPVWYDFGEDGATDKTVHPADGLYELNGDYYIVKNGETQIGLAYIDGYYYLGGVGSGFERAGAVAKNTYATVSASNSNGLLPNGTYYFGADGKMILRNGIYAENDNLYYYEDGKRVAKGLVKDGEDYYYFSMKYTALKDGTYDLPESMMNGFLPAGNYYFENYKLILRNGIYEEKGNLYFYENNEKVKKGLVKDGEDYYYFSMKYAALKDGVYYLPESMMNGLLPAGNYYFENYKLIIRNGIYEEKGNLYFFENNEKVKKGLVKDGEDYYYFSMKYAALKDGVYYLPESMMNGLLPAGNYLFENYKLIIRNGIYEEKGNLYFFENNEKVKKGLVKDGEDYRYFSMKYVALKDGTYYLPEEMMNGLLPAGNYLFADSKLVIKNGMYEEHGNLYYYENNVKVKKGLVKVGDDYYYFSMRYTALKDGTYDLPESMMNGLLPAGKYTFNGYKLVLA